MKIYNYDRIEAIKNGCYTCLNTYKILKDVLIWVGLLILFAAGVIIPLLIYDFDYQFISILFLILFFGTCIVLPFIYFNERNKNGIWLYRAFIRKKDKVWMIEQIPDIDHINSSNEFVNIFDGNISGKIVPLNQLKLIRETTKKYYCTYVNENGNSENIEIIKAYKNLKEVF